jgi:hypothetical protein
MCLYDEAQTGFRTETAHRSAVGGPCQKCSPVNAWQPFIEFIDDKTGIAAEL